MKPIFAKYCPFLPLLVLCGYFAYRAIGFPVHDFANYYFGGKFLADGNFNTLIYFPYEFNKAISDLGHEHLFAAYAPNTPFLAVVFAPLSLLAVGTAKLLFNCLSIVLLAVGLIRLFSHYRLHTVYALLIPVLFMVPIKNDLLFGQVYFVLFFLLAEGWLAYEKQSWKKMALFWGLVILLKVFPMILIFPLVFRKQWKPLLFLLVACLALFGISLLFVGIDVWLFYFQSVMPKASKGELATAFVDNYQSVLMLLKRLFIYDVVENPNPWFRAPGYFSAASIAFKIGMLALGYFISRKPTQDPAKNNLMVFGFWMLAANLLSPYGSTYTFILWVFPVLALLKSTISTVLKAGLLGLLFLVCNLPLSLFIDNGFPFSYVRLLLVMAFFMGFALISFRKSTWIRALALGCLVFFAATFRQQDAPERSTDLIAEGSPILTYDYEVANDGIHYYYWNEKGRNNGKLLFHVQSAIPLKIKHHQVFYNKRQLTFDNSKKRKAILLNHKTLLYLSDQGRGIGFYAIRKLKFNG